MNSRTFVALVSVAVLTATGLAIAQGPSAGEAADCGLLRAQRDDPEQQTARDQQQGSRAIRLAAADRSVGPASGRLASLSASCGTGHRVHRDVHGASARV